MNTNTTEHTLAETVPPRQPLLLHRDHRRRYEDNRYVYPVLSRRSKGLSIGINLNPDKICNFDCIYCQVDRKTPPSAATLSPEETGKVEAPRLLEELEEMLDLAVTGDLYASEPFRSTPLAWRRLNDLAFSGDGEPTTCPEFLETVQAVAESKRRRGLKDVKLILITNASRFHQPRVQQALAVLDANQGEIWAKLEAGTEAYYRLVDRTTIPFQRILDNITKAARVRPLVIQALFLRLDGAPPPPEELEAFCARLNEISRAGGKIALVQVYTVARPPAEVFVTPLEDAEVDGIVDLVRSRTGLPAEAFYRG